jgi:hypothetical protein
MAVQYPAFKNTLTKGDLGIPDYAEALNKGLNLFQNAYKSAYTPRNLENVAIKAEQYNQERQPYAENANRVFEADIGGKEGNLRKLLFDMAQKKREYQQQQFLNNFIAGGNQAPPQPSQDFMPDLSGNPRGRGRVNPPGHMTSQGFEGSLTGLPAEDYYANTGPDLQAEKEAIDRIDKANAAKDNMPVSEIQSVPNFAQNISQGMQGARNQPRNLSDMTPMERINYAYENYPQYAKALNNMGYKYHENTLTGPARDAESMKILRDKYGKDSAEVKEAEADINFKRQRNEDLSSIRHRQINGLKPGDTEIKDPNSGETIGFKKQTTDKQKEMAKNVVLFNELYPLVFNGAGLLSGPGATLKLEEAARNYKTNPKSREIIDNFNIALKALTTTAVTEAARFGAGRTNQTFNRFVETLKAEDIPATFKKLIKEYEIPYQANIKAGVRWQQILNAAEKKANSQIPATMDYYFDPEKQFAHEQEQFTTQNENNNKPIEEMSDEELMKIAG